MTVGAGVLVCVGVGVDVLPGGGVAVLPGRFVALAVGVVLGRAPLAGLVAVTIVRRCSWAVARMSAVMALSGRASRVSQSLRASFQLLRPSCASARQ